jgi:hypothetical protein
MHVRIVGVQDELIGVRRAEMKNPRFVMIDPDDGVKMMAAHQILLAGPKTEFGNVATTLNWVSGPHIAMLL